ncbi:MAG: enoyl-[acyl-carrier-protein] reductase FabK, partial [Candidatus Dadabacteria bacterium]
SSVRTALKARDAGVDIIIAEGVESGGKVSPDEVPTISLIPQVVDAVDVPVVAAGGLAEGRGLLAALALGAVGVQMGTRFLACTEADMAHDNWKRVLVQAGDNATAIACRKSSPTRMIKNQFFDELDALDEPGKKAMHYMPVQAQGMARIPTDTDGTTGNYVAGTGAGLIHEIRPAAEIVAEIVDTAAARLRDVQEMFHND